MLEQKDVGPAWRAMGVHVVLQIVAELDASDDQTGFWGYMKEDRILETSEHCSSEEARGQLDTAIDLGRNAEFLV
ncbi:MAG TPA: hypothetical protein VFS96_03555 [Nitrolancea sp.]|nr:hypothetical protein [Nitrolancea sp.]